MIEALERRTLFATGPDLVGGEFYIANPTMVNASTASVTFMVINAGTVNADAGAFDVRFYWSAAANFAGAVVPAPLSSADPFYQPANPNAVHFASLAHSSLAERTITIAVPQNLPIGTDGECYLGMRIDEANTVAEYNESNNNNQGVDVDSALAFWQKEAARYDMSASPGWSLQGQWAYGMPLGLGGDPSYGFNGFNVLGYNLSGTYPANLSPTQWATSPAISTTGFRNVSLSFRRWLGVDSSAYDHAYIQASTDGSSWTTIWSNTAAVIETSWSSQTYVLPGSFDNQPSIYIRFGMGTTDAATQYAGWNIDDIIVRGLPLISASTGAPRVITDTGTSSSDAIVNLDNSTSGKRLTFEVTGTVPGATVTIYADGISIGSATATSATTDVQTNGSYDLADGVQQIAATQVEAGKTESPASPLLLLTVDTTPPSQFSFQVNDGGIQRSMVTALQVIFAEPVALSGGVALQRRSGALVSGATASLSNPSGDLKTYVVTFSGSAVVGGSVPDGRFRLYFPAASVMDVAGNALPADLTDLFYRLFGDVNADRIVNRTDMMAIRAAMNQPASSAWYFDYNASGGLIDVTDYQQFRRRLIRPML